MPQDDSLTAELATRYMALTLDHVRLVAEYLSRAQRDLSERAIRHDASKFIEPEFSAYARNQPRFDNAEYGSPEYIAAARAIKPAIKHHYQMNSHHPEHYSDGILGMSLFDVVEMLCDWMAACQRSKGEVHLRLDMLVERFGISEQLLAVIWNTVRLIDPRFEHTAPNVFSIEDTLP